ncbi:MAG: MaoC family dehydratase N-terminal domain-containing protein [Actinobacteria bacterium]|nr:MaoC family dehydratase N-terminal domain-containing protein [Actinomycetota bacterium]MBI3685955.1 MaoC family dehydratase N-terminal domain-containing protein [Actinomycetota bacterium]
MTVSPEFVGRSYPPTAPYEVCREKIREFADAIGDPNPAFRDPQSARDLGHLDVIAPPTFPVIVSFLATRGVIEDPDLGIDYSRVVHGEQRFSYTRPVRAGDRLVGVASVTSVRRAAGNDLISTGVEVSTAEGEPVVTVHSTIVVRGIAQER